ncbi:MAG TPA: LacI family DNA-binding transcriptional regulator [Gaiellaceae bacterium]|nr:LacI family DNA-binding transcriptional regulator [Gaiellaceae bacterium]
MTSAPAIRRPTIREIAQLAGVSVATVSRVMNDREDVAPETRELVQRIVRERGYTTNRSARGLSAGRTGLIGATVPQVHPAFFSFILSGASEAAYERDMRLVLCSTQHEHEREVTLLDRMMHGTTDGGLLILPEESAEELERLLDHGYRFVVVDPLLPLNERIPAVSSAHSAGADLAVKHLLSLGHRRIAAITGPRGWIATEERLRGYHAALGGAGILAEPDLVVEANFQIEPGYEAARQLLDLPNPPTAVFGFNDNIAIGTMQAAHDRGLRVPDDLSVVGFDDVEAAAIVTPSLTTVRQPLAEMGRMAVSLLERLLENQTIEALHVELRTQLIVRDSTAPPT